MAHLKKQNRKIRKVLETGMKWLNCSNLATCVHGRPPEVVVQEDPNNTTCTTNNVILPPSKPNGLSVHYLKNVLIRELMKDDYSEKDSIHDIEDFHDDDSYGFIRKKVSENTSSLNHANDNFNGDRDENVKTDNLAFIDCIGGNENVGPASIYISYCRDTAIGDIVECLEEYCTSKEFDLKTTYVWIDVFCMNQKEIEDTIVGKQEGEALKPMVKKTDLLRKRCESRVKMFESMLCVFGPWHRPLYLTRMWCLFEMYTCVKNGIECEVLMRNHDKDQFIQNYRKNGARIIYENYYSTSIKDAILEESDVEEIGRLVDESETLSMNITIGILLRKWCMGTVTWGSIHEDLKYNYVNRLQNYLRPLYRRRYTITRGGFKFQSFQGSLIEYDAVDDDATTNDGSSESGLSSLQSIEKSSLPAISYDNPSSLKRPSLNSKSLSMQLQDGLRPIDHTDLLEAQFRSAAILKKNGESSGTDGISVAFIQNVFLNEVKEKGFDPMTTNIYDVLDVIIKEKSKDRKCSTDGKKGTSYINCLENKYVGDSDFFLSYCWAYYVGYIVGSLTRFCETENMDPEDTFLWMDCFCVNQHRVAETNESMPFSDLRTKFESQVQSTGHVLAMMLPWYEPIYFKRAWCLYEIYSALEADVKVTVIMSPQCDKSMMNLIMADGLFMMNHLYQLKAEVRIESAKATNPKDLENILKAIRDGPGYATFNNTMGIFMTRWVSRNLINILKKSETEVSSDNLDLAKCYNVIGYSLCEKGDHERAINLFEKSLKLHERSLGGKDIKTAIIYNNLGCTFHDQGKCDEALHMHKRALKIREETLGVHHEETASSYNNIGCILLDLNRQNEAKKYLQSALKVHQQTKVRNSLSLASIYHNMGCLSQLSGELSSALNFHQHALKIQLLVLGKYHPQTASSFQQMCDLLTELGNEAKAAKYRQEAIDIRIKTLGLNHAHTKVSRDHI